MARKRQRESEIVQLYETLVDDENTQSLLVSKADDDLFVVDRVGSKRMRRKITKEEEARKTTSIVSKVDRKLVEKLESQPSRRKKKVGGAMAVSDIWADEVTPVKDVGKGGKKKAIKIPEGGLSYNPSHDDHQDILAEVFLFILPNIPHIMLGCCLNPLSRGRPYEKDSCSYTITNRTSNNSNISRRLR
jgi:hypothetical protein